MGPYEQITAQLRQMAANFDSEQARIYNANNPKFEGQLETLKASVALFDYLEEGDDKNASDDQMMNQPQ